MENRDKIGELIDFANTFRWCTKSGEEVLCTLTLLELIGLCFDCASGSLASVHFSDEGIHLLKVFSMHFSSVFLRPLRFC